MDAASLTQCTCLWVYDRWAQNVAGSPVIHPKAGAVKAPELSPYYSSIYISGSLSACSLGFALSTRSLQYIYVTRWRLSVHLLGFAIFTVSHPILFRSGEERVRDYEYSKPQQMYLDSFQCQIPPYLDKSKTSNSEQREFNGGRHHHSVDTGS